MATTLNQKIGKRLKELRREAGYTTRQLAILFDCTETNYRRIENGVQILSPDKFYLLNRYLGIDPLYLLTGEKRFPDNGSGDRVDLTPVQYRGAHQLFSYCMSMAKEA